MNTTDAVVDITLPHAGVLSMSIVFAASCGHKRGGDGDYAHIGCSGANSSYFPPPLSKIREVSNLSFNKLAQTSHLVQ